MKKFFLLIVSGLLLTASSALAQEDKDVKVAEGKKSKQENQEIIIRKKGDKNEKITVVVDGDNITINGKPLSEFKDDNVSVSKRKSIIRNGDAVTVWGSPLARDTDGFSFNWSDDNDGKPQAFLGVTTNTTTDDSKEHMPNGAEITDITKNSAAEKAGLKEGDVIYKINDKKVEGPAELSTVVSSFKPKDEVTVYYKRDGKEMSAKAILGERKGGAMAYSFSGPGGMARSYTLPGKPLAPFAETMPRIEAWGEDFKNNFKEFNWNGDNVYSFTSPRHQKLGIKIQDTEEGNGVKVLNVEDESAASKAGLKKDDIVTEINGQKVKNTDEAREQLQEVKDKPSYTIKAKRNGSEMSFDIKIPKKLKTTNL